MAHDNHDGHHITPLRLLVGVLVVLLVLTALTVYTAINWNLGAMGNTLLAIAIATVKATLVCMYFMHLRYDNQMYTAALVTCVGLVLLFLGISIGDIATRGAIDPVKTQLVTPIPNNVADAKFLAKGGESVQAGRTVFMNTCAGCHTATGGGGPLGANLLSSKFIASHNDDQLVEYITTGRDRNDPDNRLGMVMPPKGGNPSLTEDQLHQVVDYIRAIRERHAYQASHFTAGRESHGAASADPGLEDFSSHDTHSDDGSGGDHAEDHSGDHADDPAPAADH